MPATETQSTVEEKQAIRQSVRELCKDFPDTYWRQIDKAEAYPDAFVKALTCVGVSRRLNSGRVRRRRHGNH